MPLGSTWQKLLKNKRYECSGSSFWRCFVGRQTSGDYLTWHSRSFEAKVENEKNEGKDIKINPYDNLPFHRKLIDKKNNKVEIFDLGNHILIIGMILLVIFVSINVD